MKKIAVIALTMLVFLVSCQKNEVSLCMGYIDMSLSTIDTVVVEVTKSQAELTELDDFNIIIGDNNWRYGEIKGERVPIEPGQYTALAENCTLEDAETGLGQLRIAGSRPVTISENFTSAVLLRCIPLSSGISLNVTDSFLNSFDSWAFTVSRMDAAPRQDGVVYVPLRPGETVYFNNVEDGVLKLKYTLKVFREDLGEKIYGNIVDMPNASVLNVKVNAGTDGSAVIEVTSTVSFTGANKTGSVKPY